MLNEKVLFVLADAENLYGTERALLGLIENLDNANVYSFFGEVNSQIRLVSNSYTFRAKRDFFSIVFCLFKMILKFRSRREEGIVSLNYYITLILICTKIIHKKKVISWEHAEHDYPKKIVRLLKRFFFRLLDSIVVVNERDRLYWSVVTNVKVSLIENVVFLGEEIKALKKDNNSFDVIYCGRVSFEKGISFIEPILDELNRILDKEINFVFVGGVKEFKEFNKIKVICKGYVNNPIDYIINSKVMINPSIRESYGLSVHQSLMLGNHVVCWDSTSSAETINNAYSDQVSIIRSYDIHEFALSIRQFLSENNTILNCEEVKSQNAMKIKNILIQWEAISGSL